MRFIKLALISIIVFSLVLCFLFALFPSDITVSRVINIHASGEKAFRFVSDLNHWPNWNHFTSDSLLGQISFSSPSSGKGAFIRSERLTVTIMREAPDSITTEWTDPRGKHFIGNFNIAPIDSGNIYIQWSFGFHFAWYPWEKLGAMFYEKQLGPVMERSLLDLKMSLEKNP